MSLILNVELQEHIQHHEETSHEVDQRLGDVEAVQRKDHASESKSILRENFELPVPLHTLYDRHLPCNGR